MKGVFFVCAFSTRSVFFNVKEAPHVFSRASFDVSTGAGELFVALCPGIALDPQIKYNGTYKRGKLEKVFEAAAKSTLKSMGDEGQMVSLDRLQV